MKQLIVEIGMKLNNHTKYYHEMLIKHGLKLLFCCRTHDVYYSNKDLNGLTENEMKISCVRLRFDDKNSKDQYDLQKKEQELIANGYQKVFDTVKFDMQYGCDSMKSRIQLQNIHKVGLLVYYDNPNYYGKPLDEQRQLLLNELNTYGFHFKETDLGLDKLRTLYYKKEMFSKNQNG